jgi:hypothetical protein
MMEIEDQDAGAAPPGLRRGRRDLSCKPVSECSSPLFVSIPEHHPGSNPTLTTSAGSARSVGLGRRARRRRTRAPLRSWDYCWPSWSSASWPSALRSGRRSLVDRGSSSAHSGHHRRRFHRRELPRLQSRTSVPSVMALLAFAALLCFMVVVYLPWGTGVTQPGGLRSKVTLMRPASSSRIPRFRASLFAGVARVHVVRLASER